MRGSRKSFAESTRPSEQIYYRNGHLSSFLREPRVGIVYWAEYYQAEQAANPTEDEMRQKGVAGG